jgi:hypothetical protein
MVTWRTRTSVPAAWKWLGIAVALVALGAYHFMAYVPHPDRPHILTLLDRAFNIAVAAAMVASALVLGLRILNLLQVRSRLTTGEALGLAGGLGFSALSLATLGLGLASLYYAPILVALVLAPILLLAPERRTLLEGARTLIGRIRRRRDWLDLPFFDSVACAMSAAVTGLALFFTLARDLTMPSLWTGYDTYQYHWAIPELLLQAHQMRAFPGWAHANLPFGTEMLDVIALSLRAPFAALFVQDGFLLFAAVLLLAVVSRLFGATAAWFSVATLVSVPLFVVYTSQAMVEPALVYYCLAALVALAVWLRRALDGGAFDWRIAALAGIMSGAAASVKYMGISCVPVAAAVLAWGGLAGVRALSDRSARLHVLRLTAVSCVAFGVGLLAVYGLWAVKDWVLLGNPVYPALQSWFGGPLWNSTRDQTLVSTFASFGPKAGRVASWHLFAIDLFFHPWRYSEGEVFAAGLMVFFATLGIPFGWLALRRGWLSQPGPHRDRAVVLGVFTFGMVSSALLWTLSGALVARYALPYVVLANITGAVLLAWSLDRVPPRLWLARWLGLALLLSICAFQAWVSLIDIHYTDSSERSPVALLLGQASETQALRGRANGNEPPDFWRMTDYVNHNLPHSARLLMLGRGTGYFIEARDYVADSGGDWVPYLVTTGQTPDGMLLELRRLGFRYVIFDGDLMRWLTKNYGNQVLARDLPAYQAFQQSRLTPLAAWGAIAIYAVPDQTASTTGDQGTQPSVTHGFVR